VNTTEELVAGRPQVKGLLVLVALVERHLDGPLDRRRVT
jgi:hypothetical protein